MQIPILKRFLFRVGRFCLIPTLSNKTLSVLKLCKLLVSYHSLCAFACASVLSYLEGSLSLALNIFLLLLLCVYLGDVFDKHAPCRTKRSKVSYSLCIVQFRVSVIISLMFNFLSYWYNLNTILILHVYFVKFLFTFCRSPLHLSGGVLSMQKLFIFTWAFKNTFCVKKMKCTSSIQNYNYNTGEESSQSGEHKTLKLKVMCSSPMLGDKWSTIY